MPKKRLKKEKDAAKSSKDDLQDGEDETESKDKVDSKPAKGEKRKNEKKGNDEDDKNEGDKKVALQDDEKEKLVQGLSWKSRDRQKMRERRRKDLQRLSLKVLALRMDPTMKGMTWGPRGEESFWVQLKGCDA